MSKASKIELDLEDTLDMNIEIVLKNGLPALQFRKTITNCTKNNVVVKDIIAQALDEDSDVIMPVRLKFFNKDLAKYKLKKLGILP